MDAEIFLGDYCNQLLGESFENKHKTKKSKKLQKKLENIDLTLKKTSEVLKAKNSPTKVTDDGFKICSEIPLDDSDVSDAFESDGEECFEENSFNNKQFNKVNQTEDGFKIINEIPPDDSDISDAFDSDLDEGNWTSVDKISKLNKGDIILSSNGLEDNKEKLLNSKLKNVKKPLLDLIKDFGMEDKFICDKSISQTDAKANHKKRKILNDNELSIKDYSKKRGKKKKSCVDHVEVIKDEKAAKKEKKKADEALKKARYDVFKLGTLGSVDTTKAPVNKEDRRNAKIDLVVKLGAKPLKSKPVNYKKLIEIRKEKKETEKEKREEDREMGLPVKKNISKPKHNNEIDVNPRIGKFRGGVLTISKKDLATINSS